MHGAQQSRPSRASFQQSGLLRLPAHFLKLTFAVGAVVCTGLGVQSGLRRMSLNGFVVDLATPTILIALSFVISSSRHSYFSAFAPTTESRHFDICHSPPCSLSAAMMRDFIVTLVFSS